MSLAATVSMMKTRRPCPISVYGRTRVEAEAMVLARPGSLVIRVGLAIGPSPNGRTGHWDWLRYRIGKNLPVTIVHDEYRSVVWAHDLALRVMRMARKSRSRHPPCLGYSSNFAHRTGEPSADSFLANRRAMRARAATNAQRHIWATSNWRVSTAARYTNRSNASWTVPT